MHARGNTKHESAMLLYDKARGARGLYSSCWLSPGCCVIGYDVYPRIIDEFVDARILGKEKWLTCRPGTPRRRFST